MKPKACVICNNKITTGRKTHYNNEIVCNSNECFAEWFLNNSNFWGYDK